ncbi:MAG: Holliday junction resolvase RuvX [Rhodospirillaceae bacterium]|nr:Holliday junction resolvase RuvX [Rhodospirillaceae bacterium]MDE0360173.1 Holliday junction resolvase RuvX [Rhodospirillaceae bacterium]
MAQFPPHGPDGRPELTPAADRNILLAFDFGYRRIGVATGNLLTGTATPLGTMQSAGGPPWDLLDRSIEEWRPGRLLVGIPGGAGAADVAAGARDFADALKRRYGLQVVTTDEQLTSRAAESRLREARASGRMTRRVNKGDIDSHAACIIAEQWMGGPA